MTSKQEASRKQIYEFYLNNRSEGKKYTLDYFLAAKIPRQTISDIIKRAVNNLGHERMSGSGRVAKKMTKTNIKGLKNSSSIAMVSRPDRSLGNLNVAVFYLNNRSEGKQNIH